ncbi:sugar ABC transporter ATP-binding protein [Treponema sp. J25]|uniref:sugar ABC transporter ATP-binding protein n=1 Tax=Treponema sp. J25 TaxID=2094121 RepID=UPI00104D6EDA|nr:sugar ABC transporter ATP-binding protein [Treponema sp. J25]TCW61512.1 sugar ABC transporter ATP-binding protein [Treponema sp. J25]
MAETSPLLEFKGITKDFYGTPVLQNVSFAVRKGEICALVGENGAGKTTLMSILFGMPVITETGGYTGTIYLNGKAVQFSSPMEAIDAGIGMVHQEFSLIPGFTAYENIMLNREPLRPSVAVELFGDRLATLDRPTMKKHAQRAIERLGVTIDVDMPVADMPIAHKQFTEIAREIDRERVQILVLDEPTAVLTENEAAILLEALQRLAEQGIAIIFISHRLHEVTQIAHTIVVLRDGKVVQQVPNKEVSVRDIASWMVGREVKTSHREHHKRSELETAPEILQISHLWVDMPGETVRDVSFSVRKGEIFGIGGLAGQGKLGIPNGIMGLYPAGGTVLFQGKELNFSDPRSALTAGIAFVSEDRRGVGLLLDESLDWNIAFTAMQVRGAYLKKYLGGLLSFRDEKAMQEIAQHYIQQLGIKCTSYRQPAKELSGGNQQKVCLSKAFALEPELLFVSEPSRGIDVGAKSLVLDTLLRYNREKGTTIVMVSSELEELRSICDRIALVYEGKIAGILEPDAPLEEFGLLMSGGNQ